MNTKFECACVSASPYHLVGGVVCLELLMGWVLHVNGMVSDDRGDRGVVADHRLCTLLAVQFQERLQGRTSETYYIFFLPSHKVPLWGNNY